MTPAIFALAAGKGGTGKTTLALAVGEELRKIGGTLLMDCDFYGRGLTDLLADHHDVADSTPTTSLSKESYSTDVRTTDVLKIDRNLWLAPSPPFDPELGTGAWKMAPGTLRDRLEELIDRISSDLKCDFVVLDCHGGPDLVSLAACDVAGYSIIVSEPDRQSVDGTLNLLGCLRSTFGARDRDVRLVFNRVERVFSSAFLLRFYADHLSYAFDGRPLLGILPVEAAISKCVGRDARPTKVYPFVLLSKKTALLVNTLLRELGSSTCRPEPLLRYRTIRQARFAAMGGGERAASLYPLFGWSLGVTLAFLVMLVVVAVLFQLRVVSDLAWWASIAQHGFVLAFSANMFLSALMIVGIWGAWTRLATDEFTRLWRTGARFWGGAWLTLLGVLVGAPLLAGGVAWGVVAVALQDSTGIAVSVREVAGRAEISEWMMWSLIGAVCFSWVALPVRSVVSMWEELCRYLETGREPDVRWESLARLGVLAGGVGAVVLGWMLVL